MTKLRLKAFGKHLKTIAALFKSCNVSNKSLEILIISKWAELLQTKLYQ